MSNAPDTPPAALQALFDQAMQRHRAGAFEEAAGLYRRVLEATPGQPDALKFLGLLEQERGRFPEARELLTAALAARPDDAMAWARLAVVQGGLGALVDALGAFTRAIELEPRVPDAFNGRGNVLMRLGRLDEALETYDQALQLQPDLIPALSNRGVALRDLGRAAEAIESYDRALKLRPDHVFTLNNKGVALIDQGRAADALACFDRALALKGDYVEAWHNRGRALATSGDPLDGMSGLAEALESFDRALMLNPRYAEALDNKGVLLVELGRAEEAAALFERAIEIAPRGVRHYYHLVQARRLQPSDPRFAALKALAGDADRLSLPDRIDLDFALGQAMDDAGDAASAFPLLAEGNALRRMQIPYDEARALAELVAIEKAFTPELMAAKAGKGSASAQPVFIVGMPRSGTTLIEQILASQPGVHAAGETAALPEAVAVQTIGERRLKFPEGILRLAAKGYGEIGARYAARLAAAAPDAVRVIDKRPDNFRLVGLVRLALPNSRIIVARRNPMDTCLSIFSKQFGAGVPYGFDLGELGRYHRAYERLMAHWRGLLPPDCLLEVEYEALVADPQTQSRRILDFCGLEAAAAPIDLERPHRRIRTASALQARQAIYSGSVGRWRRYEPFLGPLQQALGETATSAPRSGRPKRSRK